MTTVSTAEGLDALPVGSIVTTPFPDLEGNVAERASDGWWLITGEESLLSSADLLAAAEVEFTILRRGYAD